MINFKLNNSIKNTLNPYWSSNFNTIEGGVIVLSTLSDEPNYINLISKIFNNEKEIIKKYITMPILETNTNIEIKINKPILYTLIRIPDFRIRVCSIIVDMILNLTRDSIYVTI